MRLKARSSVDLPHPEGPMKAVMLVGQGQADLFSAWVLP